jgi:hypothetical protein
MKRALIGRIKVDPCHSLREHDKRHAPGLRRSDRDQATLSESFDGKDDALPLAEDALDIVARQTVLLAFETIALIPIEASRSSHERCIGKRLHIDKG